MKKKIVNVLREPSKGKHWEYIDRLLLEIAGRIRNTNQDDELEAIERGVNMMAEEAQARKSELLKIRDGEELPVNGKRVSEADRKRVEGVALYIMTHLDEVIILRDLAYEAGMSASKLKQTFKDVYGITVSAFLYEARMCEANKLLRLTDLSIKKIAQRVGYRSESSFTVAFKRRFMVLPKEIRLHPEKMSD